MPLYELQCKECEYKFDVIQKMDESRIMDCPNCGTKDSARQIFTSMNFVLKGHGWSEGKNEHERIDRKNGKPRKRKPKDEGA